LKSKKEGVRVIEPARQNYYWQAKAEKGFALKDFSID